jgi:hypothetical protein
MPPTLPPPAEDCRYGEPRISRLIGVSTNLLHPTFPRADSKPGRAFRHEVEKSLTLASIGKSSIVASFAGLVRTSGDDRLGRE